MRPLLNVLIVLSLVAAFECYSSDVEDGTVHKAAEDPLIELLRLGEYERKPYHPRSPVVRENNKEHCHCATHLCSCCTVPATVFNLPLKGCVDFIINAGEKTFEIKFSFLDKFSFGERLSTQGLDSECGTILSLRSLGYCFKTESTETNENGLTVCSSLEFQIDNVTVVAIRFSCLNLKDGQYNMDYPQESSSPEILNIKVKNPLKFAWELIRKFYPDDTKPDPKVDDNKPDPKEGDNNLDCKKDDNFTHCKTDSGSTECQKDNQSTEDRKKDDSMEDTKDEESKKDTSKYESEQDTLKDESKEDASKDESKENLSEGESKGDFKDEDSIEDS